MGDAGRHGTENGAPARARLRWAWFAGALPALLLFAWVLLVEGDGGLLQRQYFDDFYDVQARSIFDGRLDVPPEVVGFEGFEVDGHTYIYFGPVPALLRMPVLALTDRFDGRLATLSMLAAAVVVAVAGHRLMVGLRDAIRGEDHPVSRRERWAVAGFAFALLTGPPLFTASTTAVYHEAALWGLALALASYDAILRWLRDPRARRLAVAGTLLGLALLTRQVVAFGPLAALLLGGVRHLVVTRPWSRSRAVGIAAVAGITAAWLVPLALSCAVNYAKFDQLFGVPIGRQAYVEGMGNRAEVLAANPSYVSLEYLPTTLLTYLRPDGVEPRSDFPWVDFPRDGPTVVGGATFDVLDWTSSLPATAPAFVVLTLGGLVWRVRSRGRLPVPLWPLYAGASIGAATVLVFAYVANRYLLDLYPLVVIGAIVGLVGFHAESDSSLARTDDRRKAWVSPFKGGGRRERRSARPRHWSAWGRVAMVGLGGMVALGALTNLALALELQHERGWVVPEERRARWIDWRLDLPGAPTARTVGLDERMPPVADGELLAVGDCDGLYVGVRDQWAPVQRGPGVGLHDVRVDATSLERGVRYPVATFGRGEHSTVVATVRLDDDTVRVDILGPAFLDSEWQLGNVPIDLDDGSFLLLLDADPRQRAANVRRGNTVVNPALLPTYLPPAEAQPLLGQASGQDGVENRLPGDVDRIPADSSLCRRATR